MASTVSNGVDVVLDRPPALNPVATLDDATDVRVPEGREVIFVAFIEKLLNLDADQKYFIVTCGEESHLAYNRVGLTEYFAHRNVEDLYLNPPSWYAQHHPHRLSYHLRETVTHLSPEKNLVHTSKNRSFSYSKCVIAAGSRADLPSYVPLDATETTRGVFVYRNIADLEGIISYAEQPSVKHAVVVGGGLLGLEAAKAVYDIPSISRVSIINRSAYPLSRQLDAEAGEMVLHQIEAMGVQVLTRCSPTRQITRARVAEDGPGAGEEIFTGFEFQDGSIYEADLVIYAIGIRPRDDVARTSGLQCYPRGGIIVSDDLKTSVDNVYAIGECASWRENSYGLIGPGVEMADILAFNLTQTASHAPRMMNAPDLSTKLKLMGVDVASFGDYFVDRRLPLGKTHNINNSIPQRTNGRDHDRPDVEISIEDSSKDPRTSPSSSSSSQSEKTPSTRKGRHGKDPKDQPINCLVYKDPFGGTYKKYIFTEDGKYLLGGMMVGDVSDFVKLVAIVKKKKALEVPPSQFIVGSQKGDDDGGDLDDDAQVCSCHNVMKGTIVQRIKDGSCLTIPDLKAKTKVGTGCGGCMPLIRVMTDLPVHVQVTKIFNAEMKKAGQALNINLCPHFAMSRQDLFNVIKVKNLRSFTEIMKSIGVNGSSIGYNEHVMKPTHHQNQDTNDRFMANMQRNGTFSVVPRIPAGEISPDGLIAIGKVAKRYGLYTKITGGQRIDMFGARKDDLPAIWEELNKAGFESGHAYGKSLRTVKSCVGTTWCRYGVGDSVGLAVQLENRYKGVRSPHKFKGGVSGCVRECAEAQGKDFGIIATDKGWNIFVGGNGGANPRHADLFAKDVPPSKVVRIIDRFLAYYIMTADRLERTARWIERMDGGIEKLRKVILQDELGICKDLETLMDNLVSTYEDEWAAAVKDPSKRKQFKQFVNTDEKLPQSEVITERGQHRPADWPKAYPPVKFSHENVVTAKSEWKWVTVAKTADLLPNDAGTTSAAVKYGNTQLAIFHVPNKGYYATQQMCPHKRAFVLDHGIIGDTANGNLYVSCPLHKRNFALTSGECLNDSDYQILTFDTRENPDEQDEIQLLLPPTEELDAVVGTEKWLVRQAESEALGLNTATQIKVVGPKVASADVSSSSCGGNGCGKSSLEW
ncbi:hypothetical protein C0995_007404 [Termitomyces sp. Mi166|nr:hypothetical protein C0995_007404 [Termitomyces sp. Mi166\